MFLTTFLLRTMGRIAGVLLAIAGALGTASVAQAQVATPSMNPVAVETIVVSPGRIQVPNNPATLPWSGPSRIGIVLNDLEAASSLGGVTMDPSDNGDGMVLQGRVVGEMFSVAAELYDFTLTELLTSSESSAEGSLFAGAVQFAESVAIGIGQQTSDFSNPNGAESATLPMVGVSVRLADVFYVGFASGDETVEQSGGGSSREADRGVTRVGLAYLWRDGGDGFRFEYFQEAVDSINDPVTMLVTNETETTGFALEAMLSNWFGGYESHEIETTDATGVVTENTDRTKISIGWTPGVGLSFVLSLLEEEQTSAPSGDRVTIDTLFAGASWGF